VADEFDVACAADEAYAPHAAAMLHSLIAANPPGAVRAHFLHPPGFPARAANELGAMVRGLGAAISVYEIREELSHGLPSMGRISEVMWYRLALPELLPGIERVLYLDCDVLVLGSLAPLWRLDLGGCAIGAVTNVFPPNLLHRPGDLGLGPADYFNSGVLLMDLDRWRTEDWAARVLARARSEPRRMVFPDQDALNLELHRSRLPLHPRWNCQNSILFFRTGEQLLGAVPTAEARAHPAILHFEGPDWAKPWHYLSRHPSRDMYFDYRAHTPWPEVQLEGRTLKNRVRRALPEPALNALRQLRRTP
jgi:lipopolysaccharide biosynthesis glycosyltransferase